MVVRAEQRIPALHLLGLWPPEVSKLSDKYVHNCDPSDGGYGHLVSLIFSRSRFGAIPVAATSSL